MSDSEDVFVFTRLNVQTFLQGKVFPAVFVDLFLHMFIAKKIKKEIN